VRDGQRVDVDPGFDGGEEARADSAVIGGELGGPKRLALAGAENDVEELGLAPLDASDLLCVEAELEDVGRLRVPSELRVGDVVAPRAEARGRVDALEKVGDPAPAVVLEAGLVDHLGACAHRLLGRGGVRVLSLDDLLASVAEPLEVGPLVLSALAPDQLGLRVVDDGALEFPAPNGELELGQMLALEEVVQIRRRKDQPSLVQLDARIVARERTSPEAPARGYCSSARRDAASRRSTRWSIRRGSTASSVRPR
jgi:hypothetical protein